MASEENKADAAQAAEGEGRLVGLVSAEGDRFEVPHNVAIMSELVKTMIDGTWDAQSARAGRRRRLRFRAPE